jgi:AhpD family alkylhydroperoxidase
MSHSPRIEPLHPSRAEPEVAALLDRLPPLPHFHLLAHAQSTFAARLAYGDAMMSRLDLESTTQELVILRVAMHTSCEYIAVQHRAQATRIGTPTGAIAAVAERELRSPDLSRSELAILGLVDEMILTFGASPRRFAAARPYLTDRQLVEVGLVVERYLGLAILLNTLDVPASAAQPLTPMQP